MSTERDESIYILAGSWAMVRWAREMLDCMHDAAPLIGVPDEEVSALRHTLLDWQTRIEEANAKIKDDGEPTP